MDAYRSDWKTPEILYDYSIAAERKSQPSRVWLLILSKILLLCAWYGVRLMGVPGLILGAWFGLGWLGLVVVALLLKREDDRAAQAHLDRL